MNDSNDVTMAARQHATPPSWRGRTRLSLLADVLRGWRFTLRKFTQLAGLLLGYLWPSLVRRRLERLLALGHIQAVPTIPQLLVAARDQMMLSAAEETKVFYKSQGIPWVFHNLRRFASGPATMMDPVGLFSTRDTIIEHVLQTFHRHPVYDFVLLRAHPNGMEEMRRQAEALLAGNHPATCALRSLIEDGGYHARLLVEIVAFSHDPYQAARPIPPGLVDDPYMMLGMDQFKDLQGFTSYAAKLEVTWWDALVAWLQVGTNESLGWLLATRLGPKHLRVEACAPDLVSRHIPAAPPK
ncbi:MAG: hypothetical protein KA712_11315 [Myxococcales bacterium]|nr:hypothetical protein [Myxococcales bacterium]